MNSAPTLRTHVRIGLAIFALHCLALPVTAYAQPLPENSVSNGSIRAAIVPKAQSELTLDSVLALVAAHHPLIEAAQARVEAARGSRRTAGALSNPVASYQTENAAYPGKGAALPPGTQRETSAFLTLPLEPLFQRGSRVRRATEDVNAAAAELLQVQRTVMQNAAHAFYDLAIAQAVHDEAEEEYGNYQRLGEYNRVRVTEGAAPEGDLMRVRIEVSRAATAATNAQVTVIRARAILRLYLGSRAASPSVLSADSIRVVVPYAEVAVNMFGMADSLARGLPERRPDLVAGRARTASAAANVSYQNRLTLRQVGALIGNKRIGTVNTLMGGVSIPIPLFDQNRGEIQRAAAQRVAAEQEYSWEVQKASAELDAAHQVARQLTAQLATLEPSFLDRAEESRRVTQTSYEEGAASLLDVLNATRANGEARLMYFRLLYSQRASMIDLAVAAGESPLTFLSRSRLTVPERDDSSRRREDR